MRRLLPSVLILIGLCAVPAIAHAQEETPSPEPTEDPGVVAITTPEDGATLSGTVQIVGTALHPEFRGFVVEYAVEPPVSEEDWIPIQAPVAQQVQNAVLAIWDTTDVPDDRYVLRLRVDTTNEDLPPITAQVGVTVSNATPTPLPTLALPPTAPAAPSSPTPGPSPTPLIQQPPTRTPRPSPTPGGETPSPEPLTIADSPIAPNRLRQAACQGAIVTMVIFGSIGLYAMLRGAARRELRILMYNIRQLFRRRD